MNIELSKCCASFSVVDTATKMTGTYEIVLVKKQNNGESAEVSFYIGESKGDVKERWCRHIGGFFLAPEKWGLGTLLEREDISFEFRIISKKPNDEKDMIMTKQPLSQYMEDQNLISEKINKNRYDGLLPGEVICTRIKKWLGEEEDR